MGRCEDRQSPNVECNVLLMMRVIQRSRYNHSIIRYRWVTSAMRGTHSLGRVSRVQSDIQFEVKGDQGGDQDRKKATMLTDFFTATREIAL